jgi:Kef-type K+ transport system membrane component KefB
VESLAQLGVQLLLFHLGRELSFSKLKAVWSVALVGGALQIVALSALGGVVAAVLESPVNQVKCFSISRRTILWTTAALFVHQRARHWDVAPYTVHLC